MRVKVNMGLRVRVNMGLNLGLRELSSFVEG
jgi:hypothetical protein